MVWLMIDIYEASESNFVRTKRKEIGLLNSFLTNDENLEAPIVHCTNVGFRFEYAAVILRSFCALFILQYFISW